MRVRLRDGREEERVTGQERVLSVLYGTAFGRRLLGHLVKPGFSRLGGRFLSTRLSALFAVPFRKIHHISLSGCVKTHFTSFNDFFMRELQAGERTFPDGPEAFGSPCDGRVTHVPVDDEARFLIKGTTYTMKSLLRDERLADKYAGGDMLILRLSVEDYHRYAFPVSGVTTPVRRIDGVYHTVNPMACEKYPVYKENTRTYQILRNPVFGDILYMEVGALLVGKIVNRFGKCRAKKGMEKGHFAFGGSTVVLMFEKGRAKIAKDLIKNSLDGFETYVSMGEKIAEAGRKAL